MDKQTLSNYGWIVVVILVLSVMIAMATPFGSFIAGGFKSITTGLFDVNQGAVNNLGFGQIPDQSFDDSYDGTTNTGETTGFSYNTWYTNEETGEGMALTRDGIYFVKNNVQAAGMLPGDTAEKIEILENQIVVSQTGVTEKRILGYILDSNAIEAYPSLDDTQPMIRMTKTTPLENYFVLDIREHLGMGLALPYYDCISWNDFIALDYSPTLGNPIVINDNGYVSFKNTSTSILPLKINGEYVRPNDAIVPSGFYLLDV